MPKKSKQKGKEKQKANDVINASNQKSKIRKRKSIGELQNETGEISNTVITATLFDFELFINKSIDQSSENDAKPTYVVHASLFKHDKKSGLCFIEAGKKIENGFVKSIKATYLFVTHRWNVGDITDKALVKMIVANIVWGKFCDVFALINSQSNMKLPTLPITLKGEAIVIGEELDVKDDENEKK